jgi:phosphohistidine swiveling domain-containing protein
LYWDCRPLFVEILANETLAIAMIRELEKDSTLITIDNGLTRHPLIPIGYA